MLDELTAWLIAGGLTAVLAVVKAPRAWLARNWRALAALVAGAPAPATQSGAGEPVTGAADAAWQTVASQLDSLREHVEFLDGRIDSLEERVKDRDERIAELEAELGRLRAENDRLVRRNGVLTNLNKVLDGRIAELEARIAELKQEEQA